MLNTSDIYDDEVGFPATSIFRNDVPNMPDAFPDDRTKRNQNGEQYQTKICAIGTTTIAQHPQPSKSLNNDPLLQRT